MSQSMSRGNPNFLGQLQFRGGRKTGTSRSSVVQPKGYGTVNAPSADTVFTDTVTSRLSLTPESNRQSQVSGPGRVESEVISKTLNQSAPKLSASDGGCGSLGPDKSDTDADSKFVQV